MGAEVYGDAASSHTEGDSSPIASETSTNMSWPIPAEIQSNLPLRPTVVSHQSNSVPATPYHNSRGPRFPSCSHSRSPSPNRGSNGSPRSTHSEYNHTLPLRKQYTGCKYETAMAHSRRRMPYSLGGDLLPEAPGPLKERLDPEDEKRLTLDMKELYKTLLPSADSEQRRVKFVHKLEGLLNAEWPGNDIEVHVFGSTGNKLCTSDSDVDICITTPFKELERVCMLAEFLAKNGMERIVCVSHAKVPIVKIWDPELQVACDMNVNNTMALENTRMIRTYVDVDERVRPLAMILKYWTKRRILNDAALGGTLSSYTWICLIINFLQTLSPPVLPSLQERAKNAQKLHGEGEISSSFDDNLEKLAGFGHANKSTLGELLFRFFRYYGHEVDYEKNVFSVREGRLISKEGKGWHLLQNNRLCVEEPFNTSRNLGNTADDTSFRGLHLELRRAFEAVARGDLRKCCEQYEYPPEEERTWERPAPQPRAILTPMPAVPSRGGRGGGRGGRHAGQYHRGPSNMGRRASNTGNRSNIRSAANSAFATDIALQAQQAQSILHDQLYQRIQILQAQEHELRMQLQTKALITGRAPPTLIRQPYLQFPLLQHDGMSSEDSLRVRAGSVNQAPLTAPLRQNVSFNSSYAPVALPAVQGTNTNPPSPSLVSAVPDLRRSHRRSSVANGSPRGLRAQSQPARPVQSTSVPTYSMYSPIAQHDVNVRRSPEFRQRTTGEGDIYLPSGVPIPESTFVDENIPAEYIGYYVGDASQPHGFYRGHLASSLSGLMPNCDIPAFLHNSPEYRPYPPTSSDQSNGGTPEHLDALRMDSQTSQPQRSARSQTLSDRGPLIIDGSVPPSEHRHVHNQSTEHFMTDFSTSSSADRMYDTPRTTPDTLSQGLHEQGSYDDLFGSSYETRHGSHGAGHVNGWEPSLEPGDITATGHMGRVETLSERLQKCQLSDPNFALDTFGNAEAIQYRSTQYLFPTDDHASKQYPKFTPEDTPAQLIGPATQSPAKDSRSMSTPTKHRFNGFDLEKANSVLHKSKNKGRNETWTNNGYKEKHNDHGGKPNGVHHSHMSASNGHSSSSQSWQTPKRKQKKGSKVPAEQNDFVVRAELLPADESLRKGG